MSNKPKFAVGDKVKYTSRFLGSRREGVGIIKYISSGLTVGSPDVFFYEIEPLGLDMADERDLERAT